jgi:hypothetical protein
MNSDSCLVRKPRSCSLAEVETRSQKQYQNSCTFFCFLPSFLRGFYDFPFTNEPSEQKTDQRLWISLRKGNGQEGKCRNEDSLLEASLLQENEEPRVSQIISYSSVLCVFFFQWSFSGVYFGIWTIEAAAFIRKGSLHPRERERERERERSN